MTLSDDRLSPQEINLLPEELLICIFKFLPLETILTCENVCWRWKKLANDATLWRNFLVVYSEKPGQSEEREKSLGVIASHGQNIRCLKLQYVYSYPIIKSILEKCENIIALEIVMSKIDLEFNEDIIRFQKLKKLNLRNSLLHKPNDLKISFDNFKYLEYISLCDFGLSNKNCDSLLRCKYLTHILIEKIKYLELDFVRKLIISKQKILIALHIYGGNFIDDTCMNLLSQCPLLKDLAIIRCENLSDDGLVPLANLKQLKLLRIWNNTRFTEKALLCTLKCPNLLPLTSLSFSRIENVTPVIVDIISEQYRNLTFLALYQCPKIINSDYEKQLKSKFRNINVVLY